ncbi:MAG: hypothetical protein H6619_02890 [Deltaproteobacteria bacterium]|nr:hypothetical protein [Deltaproteobacteria bacterium]
MNKHILAFGACLLTFTSLANAQLSSEPGLPDVGPLFAASSNTDTCTVLDPPGPNYVDVSVGTATCTGGSDPQTGILLENTSIAEMGATQAIWSTVATSGVECDPGYLLPGAVIPGEELDGGKLVALADDFLSKMVDIQNPYICKEAEAITQGPGSASNCYHANGHLEKIVTGITYGIIRRNLDPSNPLFQDPISLAKAVGPYTACPDWGCVKSMFNFLLAAICNLYEIGDKVDPITGQTIIDPGTGLPVQTTYCKYPDTIAGPWTLHKDTTLHPLSSAHPAKVFSYEAWAGSGQVFGEVGMKEFIEVLYGPIGSYTVDASYNPIFPSTALCHRDATGKLHNVENVIGLGTTISPITGQPLTLSDPFTKMVLLAFDMYCGNAQ